MKDDNIKLPPSDYDAESSVIGSLLIDGDSIDKVSTFLKPDDFYYEQNQFLYEACLALNKRHEAINQVTLSQELTRTDRLELCGGVARFNYLISVCPTSLDIEEYAGIVSRLSVARQMIVAGDKISSIGYEATPDVSKSLERVDAIVTSLRKSYGKVDLIGPRERSELLLNRYNNLKNMTESPSIPTGFPDLDRLLGGGQFPGELTILGGDSGLGKSTLAQDIAVNQSLYGDVLFCSGEMTVEALSDKEIAKMAGCTVIDIRAGKYSDELFDKIIDGIGQISERRIYIYRGVPLTVNGIRQAAYNMAVKNKLCSIWIDYLQKIELFGVKEEGTYRKIGNITNDLANLAKELQVPVNIIAQLGSDIDKRENKRPSKGDLYESKMIEQSADWILLLYRVDKYFTQEEWETDWSKDKERRLKGWNTGFYDSNFPDGIAEIIIEKTRFGSGKRRGCKLVWNDKVQSYQSLYHGEQGEMI